MCRLFGVAANQQVDVAFSLATGPKSFKSLAIKNPDGWGIGWYAGDTPTLHKEPLPAHQSGKLQELAANANSRIVICHVRKATQGTPSKLNCHPFAYGKWLFAHNGSVHRDALWKDLDDSHRATVEGDTDSEVYFHSILQSIEHTGDVVDGIRSLLPKMKNYTGLNFLLSDGSQLFAYRNASKNTAYYSLFYLKREPSPPGPETLRSKEVTALINSKGLRGEKAVLVCSERLTEEPWEEIPLGSLLTVSPDLKTQIVKVN